MPNVFKALSDPIFRQDVKRGVMDALNRGMVAGGLGAPVDLATMALRPFGYNVEKPVGGSEWIGDKMRRAGMVSDQRNALAEAAAGMLAPTGYADPIRTGSAIAGLVAGGGAMGDVMQAVGPAAANLKALQKQMKAKYGESYYWNMPNDELELFDKAERAARAEKAEAAAAKVAAKTQVDPLQIPPTKMRSKYAMPQELYHGSLTDIDKFDLKRLGSNTGAKDAEIGVHFAGDIADADLYSSMAAAKAGAERGVIGSYRVGAKNPLVVDESGNAPKSLIKKMIEDKMFARDYARAHGFDSIVYPRGTNVDSGNTVIVFDPEIIQRTGRVR